MVIDPVFGVEVDPKHAATQTVYQGRRYYFCSFLCKSMFEREPEKYVS
jgi:P-type Cu+ transporter